MAKNILRSINILVTQETASNKTDFDQFILEIVSVTDEIVFYCKDVVCQSSIFIYRRMDLLGFKNVRYFSGGLRTWEDD